MYINRAIEEIFQKAVSQFPVVLITGPRQSGKTTFLKEMMKNQTEYITFDDPVIREFASSDPRGFLNQFNNKQAILDEFQYAPWLLPYIKMDVDNNRNTNGKWLLTGSQQFNVMKSISDTLAGRIAILNLLPFYFHEHKHKDITTLGKAIWQGGYPENVLYPEKRELWLSSYISTYLDRDVRQIQNIHNMSVFQSFLSLCAANHAQGLSKAFLSKHLGISQPTVKEWLSVATASFVLIMLQPYYENFGKRLIKSPKLYFLDSAITAYLTRHTSTETLLHGPMAGAFFEGFIITEIYKMQMARDLRSNIYFWRSNDQTEVDLLIEKNNTIYPVEIKKTSTPTARHGDPIRKFSSYVKDKKVAQGQVVCTVDKTTMLSGDVKAVPFIDFLKWAEKI